MDKSLSGAPFAVIEVDDGLVVGGWNDSAERLFATPRDAALGRPLADLLPLDGGEPWPTLVTRAGDEQRVGVDHPTVGKRRLDVQVQRTDTPGLLIYARDVTARAAAEDRHALDAAQLNALKSTLDIVVWAVDRHGKFLVQEGKGLVAAGLAQNQLVGLNVFDAFGGTRDLQSIRKAIAGTPHHSPADVNSHGVTWENWFVPVADSAGGAAMVAISLNVNESKRREDELRGKLELIERQREVIRELSTPIIEVWDGVLTLPIVGLVDSVRTAEIMDNLLQTVTRTRARFAILDLTGVQVVDTSTASHLIGLIQAIRLLGAEGVLTGIHPNIAQTIVAIGVDLSRVRVFARLRDALEHCIAQLRARG